MERFNSPPILQRTGNDWVYGPGTDGDVVISSNVTLTRDMYYNNLTVNSGRILRSNGYRIFVKNNLTLNGIIGNSSDEAYTISSGTVSGTTERATSTQNSIGGSSAGGTFSASQVPDSMLYSLEAAIFGGAIDTTGFFVPVSGGAGGGSGANGTVTTATAGSGATSGGAGSPGHLNRNPGVAGGPGTNGTPGSNGSAGSNVPAAEGGLGGHGGAVVVVVAKNITGTGEIRAQGLAGSAGQSSATGTGATNGAAGSAGSPAPAAALAHYTDNHVHYNIGDGVHSGQTTTSAPALPRAFDPGYEIDTIYNYSESHIHRHVHRNNVYHSGHLGHGEHNHNCAGGYNYAHTYNYTDHRPNIPNSDFYHINSVDHSSIVYISGFYNHHNFNQTPVHFPHCAHSHLSGDGKTTLHNHGRWPHQHHDNTQTYYRRRVGANVAHVGHSHFPGGAGGAAGAAGTNGTNGSTTAGGNGQSGGGGGIICVTEETPSSITMSASGGTIGGVSGSPGRVITILNR